MQHIKHSLTQPAAGNFLLRWMGIAAAAGLLTGLAVGIIALLN